MPAARSLFFFFNDTATTEIYTLSLHDALPISSGSNTVQKIDLAAAGGPKVVADAFTGDRKSTRLNSSHLVISYAVFCLKKKKQAVSDDGSVRRHRAPVLLVHRVERGCSCVRSR